MRTIIDLPPKQMEALSTLCKKEHASRAEIIRRAVKKFLNETFHEQAQENIAFGIWKNKRRDGQKYIEKLRAEWDR